MKQLFSMICAVGLLLGLAACNKADYLSKRPDQSLVVPTTVAEFQSILDNDRIMNGDRFYSGVDPNFLLIAADDYFMPEADFVNIPITEIRHQYVWNDDIYGMKFTDWERIYRAIFYANVVIDGLSAMKTDGLSAADQTAYRSAMGSALFYRARYFYQLAQLYAPAYNPATAGSDPGIILRLRSDINEPLSRVSVARTYEQITADLLAAADLLPDLSSSSRKTRPSRAAAFALLAKTSLVMQDYEKARQYADSCLGLQHTLIDYNTLNLASTYPIKRDNPEIIFYSMANLDNAVLITPSLARIDTVLYDSYAEKDLRKQAFFLPAPGGVTAHDVQFKGSYDGDYNYFTGIAVDEVYLIRAEARARTSDVTGAISDLNTLMEKRWKNDGSFVPFSAGSAADALTLILAERRKELVQRGTRWSDLKRLNQAGANITVTRKLEGATYTLTPGDKRYAYLIPPDIMAFHPEMPQTPR